MKRFLLSLGLVVALGMVVACNPPGSTLQLGGSEAGNPPADRAVAGLVEEAPLSRLDKMAGGVPCAVDTVIATSSQQEVMEISIKDDCSFLREMKIGETYTLDLVKKGNILARVLFRPAQGNVASPFVEIPFGLDVYDLGKFLLDDEGEETVAYPEADEDWFEEYYGSLGYVREDFIDVDVSPDEALVDEPMVDEAADSGEAHQIDQETLLERLNEEHQDMKAPYPINRDLENKWNKQYEDEIKNKQKEVIHLGL